MKVIRMKLNDYLYEQLSVIAEKSGKSPRELIASFVLERCNAPRNEMQRKASIFNTQKVHCTVAHSARFARQKRSTLNSQLSTLNSQGEK